MKSSINIEFTMFTGQVLVANIVEVPLHSRKATDKAIITWKIANRPVNLHHVILGLKPFDLFTALSINTIPQYHV